MQIGSVILGSSERETSTAGQEVIPKGKSFYKLTVIVYDDAKVSINGGEPILLESGERFNSDHFDTRIGSFKILDDGIEYRWIAGSVS